MKHCVLQFFDGEENAEADLHIELPTVPRIGELVFFESEPAEYRVTDIQYQLRRTAKLPPDSLGKREFMLTIVILEKRKAQE